MYINYYALYTHITYNLFFQWIFSRHHFKNTNAGSRVKDTERKRNGDDDQACAGLGAENGVGEKESRVSRVTIRFGTAVVSVGSWALSICNSLYGVRDVCTWLYCIRHGNATRTISNYMMVDGKRSTGRGRVVARVVETLTRFLPLDVPLQGGRPVENSSTSSCGYSLADNIPRVTESGIFI